MSINKRLNNNKSKLVPNEKTKSHIGLICLYSNVDQLLNKMDDLQMLIASNKPDIMFFTEVIPKVQVNPIFKSQVELKGYDVYTNFNFSDCIIGVSGIRGTAIYVRVDIKNTEVKIKSGFRDHIWVEIHLEKGDSLLCGCMCRNPTNGKEASIESTTKACNVILEAVEKTTHT